MFSSDLSGQTLGQYRVIKPIGHGGMAHIYLATTPQNKPVALKVLLPHLQNQPEFTERFLREAENASRLRHKGIVRIYDYQKLPNGTTFFAMDWVDGDTLTDLMHHYQKQGQSFDLSEASRIIGQVAEALDYAHQQGVIHRDIKPSNILLTKQKRAILADFGVAKIIQATTLTQTGQQPGTPAYMAPEQAKGDEVCLQTDVYALGIVLYELLAGRPPFQGDTSEVLAVLYQQVHQPPPPLKQYNKHVPAALEQAIQKVLAKKPAERYQTAGAFAQAVEQAVRPSNIKTSRSDFPLVVVGGGVAVLLLLCLMLLWLLWPSNPVEVATIPPTLTITTSITEVVGEMPPTPDLTNETPSVNPADPPTRQSEPLTPAAISPTINPDERPILLEPRTDERFDPNSAITLTWRWQPLPENFHYWVSVRNQNQETFPRQGKWTTTERTFPIPFNLPPGVYTWLVIVETGDSQQIIRSNSQSFRVVAPPPTITPTPAPKVTVVQAETAQVNRPVLIAPEDGFSRAGKENITLQWRGNLAADQCYVLVIQHKAGLDYTWLDTPRYTLGDEKRWLSTAEFGPNLTWRVVVAKKEKDSCRGNNPDGLELSEYSVARTLSWVGQ